MPTAQAGADQQIMLSGANTAALLDGSASSSADGLLVFWQWHQLAGPAQATIVTPNQPQTAVLGLQPGPYVFRLQVTDDTGASASDTVQITAVPAPNQAPIADAGDDQVLLLAGGALATAVLDGAGSQDADGRIVGMAWRLVAGPASAVLHTPNLTQTLVSGLAIGTHVFELQVRDDRGATGADLVVVTVLPAEDSGPVARAGRDQRLLRAVAAAVLDGSASTGSAQPLRFAWSQTGGPAAGCARGHDDARLTLTGLVRGRYRYQLTVTDAQGRSAADAVTLDVRQPMTLR
jgi:hypothetical protein